MSDAPGASGLRVACLGLGKMGDGIARNVLAAGFPTTVWNRSPAKAEAFVEHGATTAATPREAAEGADVVVTCLFDDESVLAASLGEDGLIAGLAPAAVHLASTTVSPDCTRQLVEAHAAAGRRFVAAHVLGRPDVAAKGELTILAAGDPADLERSRPVLDAYGAKTIDLGPDPVKATGAKLMANASIVTVIELAGELATWAEAADVPKGAVQQLLKTVLGGPGAASYVDTIFARDFPEGGFQLDGGRKDVGLMVQAAGSVGARLPILEQVLLHLDAALEGGLDQLDWAALTEVIRRDGGLPSRLD